MHALLTHHSIAAEQSKALEGYSIYLLDTGRINMCGLNTSNVEYVAASFKDVLGVSLLPSIFCSHTPLLQRSRACR